MKTINKTVNGCYIRGDNNEATLCDNRDNNSKLLSRNIILPIKRTIIKI